VRHCDSSRCIVTGVPRRARAVAVRREPDFFAKSVPEGFKKPSSAYSMSLPLAADAALGAMVRLRERRCSQCGSGASCESQRRAAVVDRV
jgi:hypothetical protein